MSARSLFSVILRSFGVGSILLGLNILISAPLFAIAEIVITLASVSFAPDYAGGSVIHLNGYLLVWAIVQILIGIGLLWRADRPAARFYPD